MRANIFETALINVVKVNKSQDYSINHDEHDQFTNNAIH